MLILTQNTGKRKELQEKALLQRCNVEILVFSTKLKIYTSTVICYGIKNSSENFFTEFSLMLESSPQHSFKITPWRNNESLPLKRPLTHPLQAPGASHSNHEENSSQLPSGWQQEGITETFSLATILLFSSRISDKELSRIYMIWHHWRVDP